MNVSMSVAAIMWDELFRLLNCNIGSVFYLLVKWRCTLQTITAKCLLLTVSLNYYSVEQKPKVYFLFLFLKKHLKYRLKMDSLWASFDFCNRNVALDHSVRIHTLDCKRPLFSHYTVNRDCILACSNSGTVYSTIQSKQNHKTINDTRESHQSLRGHRQGHSSKCRRSP